MPMSGPPEPVSGETPADRAAPRQNDVLPSPGGPTWFRRLSSVLFVIFCFELGLFLIIYPWTDAWTDNYFSVAVPDTMARAWRDLWNNSYVRGAVSGLGLVNVWIAMTEVFQMFARRSP
ncbi:MAG: hypothetical protein ABSB15_23635 [Bryobacteraceae bacterium]